MVAADALAATLMIAMTTVAALVTTGARWRRILGLAIATCVFALPAFAEPALVRGFLGLGQLLTFLRIVDLYRERREFSARRRLWHAFSAVDSRVMTRAPSRLDAVALRRLAGWSVVGVAGLWLAWVAPNTALRWAGGIVGSYAFVEVLWAAAGFAYAAVGFATPKLHELPLASRSIQELWGERWSTPVNRWLELNLFKPCARRGWPRLGIFLAFFGSAVLHAYAAAIAVGLAMGGLMLAYFLSQAAAMLLERKLNLGRWHPVARHVWVIAVMVVTAPLFVEPMLRVLGV